MRDKDLTFLDERSGFTIVEVLLAIVVLGFSVSFIFGAFFTSLDAINETRNRLDLANLIHNDISKMKISVKNREITIPYKFRGHTDLSSKPYYFVHSIEKAHDRKNLCDIKVFYYWYKGIRKIKMSRQLLWPVTLEDGETL